MPRLRPAAALRRAALRVTVPAALRRAALPVTVPAAPRRAALPAVPALAALAAAALVPAAPAAALEPPPGTETRLESLTLAPADTSLTRGELSTVRVRAHLVDPDPGGVQVKGAAVGPDQWLPSCPCVSVTFSGRSRSQAWNGRDVPLKLASGSAQDGVWEGSFVVGAASAGRWTATRIVAGDLWRPEDGPYDNNLVSLEPLVPELPSFLVTGTDWPLLTLQLPKAPVRAGSRFVVRGTARYATSRKPAAGVRVTVRREMCYSVDGAGGVVVGSARTNAQGEWALATREASGSWCARVGDVAGVLEPVSQVAETRAFVRAVVTARAAAASVRLGRTVNVTGKVTPALGLQLERLSGRTWRRVAAAYAQNDGTYKVALKPTARGTGTYRVRALTDPYRALGSASPTFRVRAS
ncbi:peptidase associated/transthyretin-like domain-containing protein [Motilibacter deserti]|uniref:Ig-like domain-containing protein n=1 Tax=Motilibacter deserti TaxID=2714956 RepID=A0ABX0GZ62_9ACTN|nr:hypothetical protein [Motilibacter deserti]NHC15000.1 hypothetical protein [Motilibacter deserti]